MKFLQIMEFTGAPEDAEQALKQYIEKADGRSYARKATGSPREWGSLFQTGFPILPGRFLQGRGNVQLLFCMQGGGVCHFPVPNESVIHSSIQSFDPESWIVLFPYP